MEELQLQLLRLTRDATAAGLIRWSQGDDSDLFQADSQLISTFIQFRYPEYTDDSGSDRDFVVVGGAGRFMVGTTGWWLALEILAAGFPEWAKHLRDVRSELEKNIRRLSAALEEKSA